MRRRIKKTLETLELSNGEFATVEGLMHFLQFMKRENASVPKTGAQLNRNYRPKPTYMLAVRREQMEYVSKLRVSRGQSPLPARLLK